MKKKLAELLEAGNLEKRWVRSFSQGLEDHSEICPVSPWASYLSVTREPRHDDEALPHAMRPCEA